MEQCQCTCIICNVKLKSTEILEILRGLAFSLEGGSQIYWGGHKFLERKIGGHKVFDDQNVGSHKMTTDSVYFVQKD